MSRNATSSPDIINISADANSTSRSSSVTPPEDKLLIRFNTNLFADSSKIKLDTHEHAKRITFLRREAEKLEKTDWQYEPVEKLLGK